MTQFNMPVQPAFNFDIQSPYGSMSMPTNNWSSPQFNMSSQGMYDAYQAQPMTSRMGGSAGVGTTPADSSWSLWGNQNQMGVIPAGIQGLSALAQGWLGFQQLGLAKDSLAFQKDAFNKNYENQRQLTNQQLMDRQRARAAANPNAYASPDAAWQGQNLIGG